MNTRNAIDTSDGPVALTASFNSGCACFAVGLDTGFRVYNSDQCALKVTRGKAVQRKRDNADELWEEFNAGIGIAEMLGTSNYVALVGGGRQPKFPQNKVIIWDDAKGKAVITLEFRSPIRRVRLRRNRIVVALQNTVHIYKFSQPPEPLSVFETSDNNHGLCAVSPRVIAFPGRTPGQVQLVEVETGNISIIPAHTSALRALKLSLDGEILVTASEAGTLLRIFSTANCTRLGELRRGVDRAAIFDLGISPNNTLLAVTSDKSTLHVFDMPQFGQTKPDGAAGRSFSSSSYPEEDGGPAQKWGVVGKIPFLPRVFSDEYSFVSVPFESGDDITPGVSITGSFTAPPIPGLPGGRAAKGHIGWLDDETILVIGAGRDARWERFELLRGEDGKRYCVRRGWKRYLGN